MSESCSGWARVEWRQCADWLTSFSSWVNRGHWVIEISSQILIMLIPLWALKTHQSHSSVMFPTQEICSMACTALQFVILCYLIKIYRAVLQLGTNHQQDLTEGTDSRSNSERTNERWGSHIRYATEHDERQGWVSVFSFWNLCVEKIKGCFSLES